MGDMQPDPQLVRLQNYLRALWPEKRNLIIHSFEGISDGWESDVYRLQLAFDGHSSSAAPVQHEEWIVRSYFGQVAADKAARECAGLRLLRAADYPVPEVVHLEVGDSPLGRPFLILEKIDGAPMGAVFRRAAPEQQRELVGRFCELFVHLHQLAWQRYVDEANGAFFSSPDAPIQAHLDFLRKVYDRFPMPGFLPLFDWLQAQSVHVPPVAPALVHWDFHPANILMRPGNSPDSAVVIDWTQIQVSDPRFDLAWTLILVGSDAGEDARDTILSGYEKCSGLAVDSLPFFEVAACVKRLFSVAVSVTAGADQLGMRPGAERMMKHGARPLAAVYARLQALTGLAIPEIERIFASWQQ